MSESTLYRNKRDAERIASGLRRKGYSVFIKKRTVKDSNSKYGSIRVYELEHKRVKMR